MYVEDCGIDFDALLEAWEMEQQTKVYIKECVLDDLRKFLELQDLEVSLKPKKTGRDKFRACENCNMEIADRILVCAGCKKVAYCNYRCQKAHWKQHKKTCLYAFKTTKSELVEDLHHLSNQGVNVVFLNFDFRLNKALA